MDDRERRTDVTTVHVRRAIAGDDESLGWIVARFSSLLIAQAEYRLPRAVRSMIEPEDIVQEAWAVVLPKLAGIRARDDRLTPPLLRFLSTTVRNVASNVKRKLIRGAILRRDVGVDPGAIDGWDCAPCDKTGVVSGMVRSERRGAVLAAIDALEPIDREVVILRAIEQHPNHAAAELLELEPNTVAVRYRRALARLRERLPDSVFDEL